ncbi:unnamed protein product [Phytophthora fragariaefolia]|uniref:Unnamed protein product n=1 Tax=Phytophthora fragariaefolia TaxID=1490495 RepID=A0A9W6TTY4_9STRA|nr:unnamed protein product [Phytophthora fragariaefolia]
MAKKKTAKSKSSRKKIKAPDSETEDRGDLMSDDQLTKAYYKKDLHTFLINDAVMRVLRPKNSGRTPRTCVATGGWIDQTVGHQSTDAPTQRDWNNRRVIRSRSTIRSEAQRDQTVSPKLVRTPGPSGRRARSGTEAIVPVKANKIDTDSGQIDANSRSR